MFTLALVGRPNVGKSSLFNRLVGKKAAIVHEKPGVTRDFREELAHYGDFPYAIIDTPGLADPSTEALYPELAKAMTRQSEAAMLKADAIAFVLDGAAGITPFDESIAKSLFKKNKPVIVLINKADVKKSRIDEADVYALGFTTAIPVSAEHNLGIDALYQAIYPALANEENEPRPENAPIKLAVMGRPNVGKSTLINSLIGEERLLTADMPGVTRDSTSLGWEYEGQAFELIDTAGIRKKAKISDAIETMAVESAAKTLRFAEIVVLVIDATVPIEEQIEKQDALLARQIIDEGRALVIALNKADKVADAKSLAKHVETQLNHQLSQARDVPVVPVAAINGGNLGRLLEKTLAVYRLWNKRIPTAKLNDWLGFMLERHPAPAVAGRRVRIKYATQIKTRPPTFALFCSKNAPLPDSYLRYLANGLRDDFDMPGVPIRLVVKESKNPYSK